ncbi:39S ribosomal protein L9, mitochondrial [Varanus komodoensis]|uniref:Large ribosomal subunit protein bL9m n=1 Tax=Varanus komodoensis TaxID=61221 RepID=A0A8D2JB77_VARKO|nr:39S ribosomal protein L9, mitochondrial [Varanus komodoensis]KAF7238376.1 39S ribosomal protein L9, mitochondrial [Varanus komodoensis]
MLAACLRGAARAVLPAAAPPQRGLQLSAPLGTVIVERWWKVPLAKLGCKPRIKHRRFRVYRLVEDTKHSPKQPLELILTQTVEDVGNRGDTVFVPKSFGRNQLLAHNKAVYASPENKKIFEEENRLRLEGKLPKLQTHSGIKTVRFLRNCTLEIGVNDCEQWELTKEIVARHFLRNLQVVVPLHTLKLPDEPITKLGEYWCEVTVNGIDTVRVPMSVVQFATPVSESYRSWLAGQELEATPEP